jgi:hypothetical protein
MSSDIHSLGYVPKVAGEPKGLGKAASQPKGMNMKIAGVGAEKLFPHSAFDESHLDDQAGDAIGHDIFAEAPAAAKVEGNSSRSVGTREPAGLPRMKERAVEGDHMRAPKAILAASGGHSHATLDIVARIDQAGSSEPGAKGRSAGGGSFTGNTRPYVGRYGGDKVSPAVEVSLAVETKADRMPRRAGGYPEADRQSKLSEATQPLPRKASFVSPPHSRTDDRTDDRTLDAAQHKGAGIALAPPLPAPAHARGGRVIGVAGGRAMTAAEGEGLVSIGMGETIVPAGGAFGRPSIHAPINLAIHIEGASAESGELVAHRVESVLPSLLQSAFEQLAAQVGG